MAKAEALTAAQDKFSLYAAAGRANFKALAEAARAYEEELRRQREAR